MKSRLLKYGKVFATKVAMKDASPVDDKNTFLNRLEKGTNLFATAASVGAEQSLDGGQPSDYMNSGCLMRMVKIED
jgi:hypothetical protein